MTRVKICGITRIEDAVVACDLGAYAVGFIFWPRSRRFVEPERALVISDALPSEVRRVGVFVDQEPDEVRRIVADTGIDTVQLHGREDHDYARALGVPVWKAVPVTEDFSPASVEEIPRDIMVLLDAHDPVRRGGTGHTIDWALAAEAAARRPVVLSGGLTPENIRTAVTQVRPYAVDLASGVESAPGVKDHARLRALFEAIRDE